MMEFGILEYWNTGMVEQQRRRKRRSRRKVTSAGWAHLGWAGSAWVVPSLEGSLLGDG
jgi:hypothetical protein